MFSLFGACELLSLIRGVIFIFAISSPCLQQSSNRVHPRFPLKITDRLPIFSSRMLCNSVHRSQHQLCKASYATNSIQKSSTRIDERNLQQQSRSPEARATLPMQTNMGEPLRKLWLLQIAKLIKRVQASSKIQSSLFKEH